LIHWPVAFEFTTYDLKPVVPKDDKNEIKFAKVSIQQTWQAMEKLVEEGLVKSIGVSNFTHGQILDLLSYAKIVPAVNQVRRSFTLALSHIID
jgi:diketogulonate reductase-like aldo/keto reductase